MYAVVKTGGKQYRVSSGDRLKVESLEAAEGDSVTLDQVLMVGEGSDVAVGDPMVAGASVSAKVISHGRGKKVHIIKFRRRKHHRKQMGHRQNYTELEITSITGGPGGSSSSAKADDSAEKARQAEAAAAAAAAAAEESAPAAPTGELKFMDGPDGEKDDLKKISGVGPVLEEKLNNMGIYHFHQVAAFTKKDTDAIDTELNFPGRIERDDWIGQATELAKG